MQDRVSLHPGRVKLVPVPGQENTYDMVRADSPRQEGTPLNKDSLLKDATASLFGLRADAVPDDVLNWIGNFNMHYWIRSEKVESYSLFSLSQTTPYYFRAETTVTYYDSITIDESGNIVGQGEHSVFLSYSDYVDATILYTKYYIESPSKAIYFPDKVGVYRGTNDDGTRYVDVEKHNIINVRTNFLFTNHVILKSQNRNEYPDSGESGNYKYEYIGVPFENIIGCARIETGSYIGSGTFGVDNKNALAFSFVPKVVFISGAVPFVTTSGLVYVISSSSSMYACTLTLEGKTLKWYSTSNADLQLNSSGKTYYYVAIG